MPLTQDEFDRWLDELENGGHKQARGALCRVESDGGKSYCCLGVYADKVKGYTRVEKDGKVSFINPYHDPNQPSAVSYESSVLDGLVSAHDIGNDVQRVLSTLNDYGVEEVDLTVKEAKTPYTFAQIASYLREKGLEWVNSHGVE